MYTVGSVIDGKYRVSGLCSDAGGMGTVLFVHHPSTQATLVLKYCKLEDPEVLLRFRREVRVMQEFRGNAYVVPVLDANPEHSPPYFVMPYFEHGDLLRQVDFIRSDLSVAEKYFVRMIECIEQLHIKNIFHRDIKPQNFLVGNGTVVVSDLGLCTQLNSSTVFTRNSVFGGTPMYMPPEFYSGGFRNPDATVDIYMLGATFHNILCGAEVFPLCGEQLPSTLKVVIERACSHEKFKRYQSLAELRQSLDLAFSVLLGRVQGTGGALGALQAIIDRWQSTYQADSTELSRFIEELAMLPAADKTRICFELPKDIFHALAQTLLPPGQLDRLILDYLDMSENADYSWGFAEVIADNAAILFTSPVVSEANKAEMLKAAIIAADRQNRFAAMDTCKLMIMSVTDDGLAQRVSELMLQHPNYYMEHIDPIACQAPAIRHAISILKARAAAKLQATKTSSPFPV